MPIEDPNLFHYQINMPTCPNCYHTIDGRYCSSCGQKALRHLDPHLHDVFHDAFHEFFHIDGKIFRTLKLLFLRPGQLTLSYLKGQRAGFISPLRLYLTVSVIYFLLNAALNPVKSDFNFGTNYGAAINESVATLGKGKPVLSFFTGLAPIREMGTRIEKDPEQFIALIVKSFPKAIFILLPIFALILQLTFGFRYRYPQFWYFALHYHAAFCFIMTLGYFFDRINLGVVTFIWVVTYLVFAIKRVWGGSTQAALIRTSALLAIYSVCFLVALLGVLTYALFNLNPA